MQFAFGRQLEASSLGDRHKITKMSEFHAGVCLKSIACEPIKQFLFPSPLGYFQKGSLTTRRTRFVRDFGADQICFS
jgi:hypothetical protein